MDRFRRSFKDAMQQMHQAAEANFPELTQKINEFAGQVGSNWSSQSSEVAVGSLHLRVDKKPLAEGGYSFVYLAEDCVPYYSSPKRYALKKVLAGTKSQLEEVQNEIATLRRLNHPNILPIIDACILSPQGKDALYTGYLVFPLYQDNLWNVVQKVRQRGRALSHLEVVDIFIQMCAALEYMHHQEGLSHRDVKPHNVLLNVDSVGRYSAVLTDFGSTRAARVAITSRQEALSVKEDAERQCTAPYRAPELWDPPSECIIDERVDVFSAGCVLYYMLVGESPFEYTANKSGGSLALCIAGGKFEWPPDIGYPSELRELVNDCLKVQADRPHVRQVQCRAKDMLAAHNRHTIQP